MTMENLVTPEQQQLKDEIIKARGYWHPFHEGLLKLAPEYLRAYLNFQDAPARSGHLEPKIREFIYIAADGAVSHLYTSGLSRHIQMALEKGATAEEVLEVIMLAMLTSHAPHDLGLPILMEELAAVAAVPPGLAADLTEDQEAIKRSHLKKTGRWPAAADVLLKLNPDFAEAFLAYEAIPYDSGPLSHKIKELVRIAVYAAPTSLDAANLRLSIRSALALGASAEEVSEVLQLTSAISIHSCTAAIPTLMEHTC